MRRQNLHVVLPVAFLAGLGITIVGLLLLTPMMLANRAGSRPDWPLLASVGDAYGGTATMLSSVAVLGVAASLLLQWRQNRMIQLYSLKQQHLEIVKIALESPEFLYVDGVQSDPEGRLKVYANLLVSYWAMAWDLGLMSVPTLRANAARLLRQPVARRWWETWQSGYLTFKGRKRFVQIVNEEYLRATPVVDVPSESAEEGQGPNAPKTALAPPRRSIRRARGGAFVAGCMVGLAVGLGVRLSRRRRTQTGQR
jgi:hypothetical protein